MISRRKFLRDTLRGWFELTPDEQQAVVLVLCIFTLGLGVMTYRHMRRPSAQRPPPADCESEGQLHHDRQ